MTMIHYDGLLLRPFEETDAAAFSLAVNESVASVAPWMHWCHSDYTEAEALAWFRQTWQARANAGAVEFGIFSEVSGHFLGGAGLNQINHQHGFCNLGYWIRLSMQRKGVALASVRALSVYAFSTLNLHRVEIVVARGNVASAAVARKAGAEFECVARNRLLLGGEPVAAEVYSLIPTSHAEK
jgi:RimJ/RimL family protein N-acetyltransferase